MVIVVAKMLSVHLLVFFVTIILFIILVLLQLLALHELGAESRDYALPVFHLH